MGTKIKPVKIGIIGCGNIASTYFENLAKFQGVKVTACADLSSAHAREKAHAFNVEAMTVKKLLADKNIELVLNLTVPKAHGEVALAALAAGKPVYNEKPLAVRREDARKMFDLAQKKHLPVGGAPDTFMGGGLQTCRKIIDDGWIGKPVAATAFMMCHGHEHWHPNPEFYYQEGGGPLFDMGPYYLTALVSLLGPVRRVTGSARVTFPERLITSEPKCGTRIPVETPTHITGILDFACGTIVTLIMSFDVWSHSLPHIEIFGSEGTLQTADPNTFGGPIRLRRTNAPQWHEMPLTHGYTENSRGIGVADMAQALRSGQEHRANGALTYHVLDIMHAILDASREERHIELESTCERPVALPRELQQSI